MCQDIRYLSVLLTHGRQLQHKHMLMMLLQQQDEGLDANSSSS